MKKIAALFLVIITLTISSCSGKGLAYEYEAGETNYAVIVVSSYDGTVILDNYKVAFKKNATILDCTLFALGASDIEYETAGSGKSAYIKEINQLEEFGEGAESGWLYRVNGSFDTAGISAGKYKISANDVIEWLYTIDLGKSEGVE